MKKLFIIALLSMTGCSMVGPGQIGIRTHFGAVSDETLASGAHLWFPFAMGVIKVDTRIQKNEVETNAASKDMQTVVTKFALNWRIEKEQAVKVLKTIGDEDTVLANVIDPAISEVLKAATAKKTAEEILTKREELKNEVDKMMKERMAQYGIIIEAINITNVTFSHDFAQAIEAKQVAEQRAKQSEYEAIQAEKTAMAEVNRAKGQAEAQKLLRLTLSPELLQLRAVEKWDGKFPTVMGTSALPFINMNLKGQ